LLHWDRVDVLKVIGEAYENRKYLGRDIYEGKTASDIRIQMYLNEDGTIATAFPKYIE